MVRWFVLAALLVSGCDPEASLLVVDLKTDLLPAVEFDEIRVEVTDGASAGVFRETPVLGAEDFLAGLRVAELSGLPAGGHTVRVQLLMEDALVVERPLRVELAGRLAVTVVITRDCRGVMCPAAAGDASAVACLGGECVDPTCTEETPEACGEAACTGDTDCTSTASCATGRCVGGACLFEADDDLCGADQYCDPELDCRRRPDAPCDSLGEDVQLTVGPNATCVLSSLGARCWGADTAGLYSEGADVRTPSPLDTPDGWVELAVGRGTICGVRTDGTLHCGGDDWAGQIGDGAGASPSSDFVMISAEASWTGVRGTAATMCALDPTGLPQCWGHNAAGQVGVGSSAEEVWMPTAVAATAYTFVDAGEDHACGIGDDATAWCWGTNASEQLARSSSLTTGSDVPLQMGADADWDEIGAGWEFTLARKTDGTLYSWGANFVGQLGRLDSRDGSDFDIQPIAGSYVAFSAGGRHACAVDVDGQLYCWGENDERQLGAGSEAEHEWMPQQVAHPDGGTWADVGAGGGHTCALDTADRVFCWGWNGRGQLGNGGVSSSALPVEVCR